MRPAVARGRPSRRWPARRVRTREAGLPVEFRTMERNHFDILDTLADPDGELARAVLGFLGRPVS